MKRVFLLIVIPTLLVALGIAQTPAASSHTDQTNIKGCLGGSDGNYTVVEDNTGHILRITTSSVDLKPHLGHEVTLVGHRASGMSSAAADNSFAVTELNMISEHCAAVAAAPTATVSTPSETSIPAATAVTPVVASTPPAVSNNPPAATAVTPAVADTPPAETAVTAAAPATMASTSSETASTPAAAAAQTTRPPARPRSRSATPAAAVTTHAVTASTPSEPVSTPAAAAYTPAEKASTSSETASTPAAAVTKPTATAKGRSLWLLISFVVLVIVLGTLVPFVSRWRKQKLLERTGAENLSFTQEVSSDADDSDRPEKAA
ncbi:MAG: hypothetical protein ACXVZM_02435 [Terriglobales bacterium]